MKITHSGEEFIVTWGSYGWGGSRCPSVYKERLFLNKHLFTDYQYIPANYFEHYTPDKLRESAENAIDAYLTYRDAWDPGKKAQDTQESSVDKSFTEYRRSKANDAGYK